MKKRLLLLAAFVAGALGMRAQTDVTADYIKNADLSQGTVIKVGVCTYDYDKANNNTEFCNLVPVTDWDAVDNGNGKAGGLFELNSGAWLGGQGYTTPTTDVDGNASGNILGVVSCWSGTAQYTQTTATPLPAGTYTLVLSAYNSAGNVAATKNLIGFIADNGTEYLAKTTTYAVGKWTYEFIKIELSEATSGKWSLGYTAAHDGSANCPHLFISGMTLFDGAIDEAAYIAKKDLDRAIKIAEDALESEEYVNVIGKEKTDLTNALSTAKAAQADGYAAATDALAAATAVFTAAKIDYDHLVKEIAKAKALGMTITDGDYAATTTSTAKTVEQSTQALKVEEYNYVTGTYSYPVDLGEWNATGPTGSKEDQHWSGETKGHPYLEQSGDAWGKDSWTIKYDQNLTLPAGDYVFKVAGRHGDSDNASARQSQFVTFGLTVTNEANEVIGSVDDFPFGDTGLGINKAGATSFDANDEAGFAKNNNGYGWEWRYVKFTLDKDATVNVAVNANATKKHMWVSFCDATVQTDTESSVAIMEYNVVLNKAKTALADAAYENITGTERTDLAAAVAKDVSSLSKQEIEAAKSALEAAIETFIAAKTSYDAFAAVFNEATGWSTGANVGTGAFQIPATEFDKFKSIYDGVKAQDDLHLWVADELAEPTQSLKNAIEAYKKAELNEPTAERRYTLQNCGNWAGDYTYLQDTYLTFVKGGRSDQGLYGVNLGTKKDNSANDTPNPKKGYALNPAYAQAFHFEKVEGLNKYYLSQTDDDGKTDRYLTTAKAGYDEGSHNQIRTTTDRNKAYAFTVVPTSTDGQWIINVEDAGTIDFQDQGAFVGNFGRANFKIAEAEKASVSLNIGAGKFATVMFPFASITLPEGVKAYTEEIVEDRTTLELTEVTELKANVPYILKNTTANAVVEPIEGFGTACEDTYTDGDLTGVYTAAAILAGNYVLQTQKGVQAFYLVTEGTTITGIPFRAYLTVPAEAKDRDAFYFGADGEVTGIDTIEQGVNEDMVIYNLAGQRVQNLTRGIYIVNGKKVMVK